MTISRNIRTVDLSRGCRMGVGSLLVCWRLLSLSAIGQDPDPAAPALKSREASVMVLAVSDQAEAPGGHVCRMTLTPSVSDDPGASTTMVACSGCGDALRASLDHVRQFFTAHGRWPAGSCLELGFENTTRRHDGVSFSLGAALLVDALLTGVPLVENVCVTGSISCDGQVKPVGRVRRKIKAARAAGVPLVILPRANADVVSDMLVLEGPAALGGMQIVTVANFKMARAVATMKRTPEVARAIASFNRIAAIVGSCADDADALRRELARPELSAALRLVQSAIPGHFSARYLSDYANGKEPGVLSAAGSARIIDRIRSKILRAAGNGVPQTETLDTSLQELRELMPLLGANARRYASAIGDYADLLRALDSGDEATSARNERLRKAGSRIDTQRRYLIQKEHADRL